MSRSTSSSFSSNYSAMSTPSFGSPCDTPFDSPVSTPGNSPLLKPTEIKALPTSSDIKMILSDVDGTLFDDDHNIHPITREAILHIRRTRPDIPFIPVTGKQRPSCAGLIEELNLSEFPAACMHGAIIYDKDGNIEKHSPLDPTFVLGVTALMKKHNKTTMLYVADSVKMCTLEVGGTEDWEAVSRGFDPTISDHRDSNFLDQVMSGEEQIGKIFLPMDVEHVESFLTLLRTEFPNTPFKTTRALPYIIEIVAENVDKSMALEYFCNKYNIKAENVLTFGDGENDCGMLKAAGYGVSMGNAMEQPTASADYATATNNEGGVGMFLDSVFRPSRVTASFHKHNIKALNLGFTPIEPLEGVVAL